MMRNSWQGPVRAQWWIFAIALLVPLGVPVASHAIDIEWDAGTGDWFEALNWDPPQVPVGFGGGTAGDDAFINNGGTAQANVATAPPGAAARARTISVGAGSAAATLSGSLESVGVTVESAFGLSVGTAEGAATGAVGSVDISGADLDSTGTGVRIGVVNAVSSAATADGDVHVSGGGLTSAFFNVGSVQFDPFAATASPLAAADGQLEVDGNVVGGALVGSNVGGAAGTSAIGSLLIHGGDFDPRGGINGITVGRSIAPVDDSFGAGSAEGQFEQVSGRIALTDPLNGVFAPSVSVGSAFGGTAEGTVITTGLDMAGNAFGDVLVGTASGSGQAIGMFVSGGGDAMLEGDLGVGLTVADGGGTSEGFGDFGPDAVIHAVDGTSAIFSVGNTRSFGLFDNDGLGTADGELHASGAAGFGSYRVGVAEGTIQQAGIEAIGRVFLGQDGLTGNTDGDSTLHIGASLGSPNNNQVIGPGGTAHGEATIDAGSISNMRYVGVGVSDGGTTTVGTGFGPASGELHMNGGDVSTESLVVGRALFQQTSLVDAPDAMPSATGLFEMAGGELNVEAPPIGSIISTATFQVGVANSFEAAAGDPDYPTDIAAIGSVQLTDVATTGNSNLQIGIATGFDDGISSADGEVIVQGGSMHVGTLFVGSANGDEEIARGLLQLTDSSLSVTEFAAVGSGSDAIGELIALRSDVAIGEELSVGRFRAFGVTQPMRGTVSVTEASLNVGTDLFVGAQFQGGTGELLLTDVNAEVGDFLRLGASSNLGTVFGIGVIDLERSTLVAHGSSFLDSGTLRLVDSQMRVDGDLQTEFFSTTSVPPGYFNGASADVEIDLRRSVLDIGGEFGFGVDDVLRITIDGLTRGDEYGAINADTVTLLGSDLEVVLEFSPATGDFFDLIVSGDFDGISGDFGSLTVLNLDPNLSYSAGIVVDDVGSGPVEIFRLSITTVPEPSSVVIWPLLGLAVGALGGYRLRRRPPS